MKYSIIVPVYKVEKYLAQCVDSILSQSFSDFELLLVDDGSPDRSGEICEEYQKQDVRVKVHHRENGGVSAARNFGLDMAKGDYIMFVDSDDWLEVDCLSMCNSLMTEYNLDLLQFSNKRVNDRGETLYITQNESDVVAASEYVSANRLSVCVGGTVFSSNIIKSKKLRFDEGLKLGEDQLFMFRYANGCHRCMRIKDLFYCYRYNMESACVVSNPKDCVCSIRAFQSFELRNLYEEYVQNSILRYFLYPILKTRYLSLKEVWHMLKNESFSSLHRPFRKFEKPFFMLYRYSRFLGLAYLYYVAPQFIKK